MGSGADQRGHSRAGLGAWFHADSVTKCKAHLSKSEQATLDDAGRTIAASSGRADEVVKEGARDDSSKSILYDTNKAAVETSRAIVNYVGNFILRAKGGEGWTDVVAPQRWDEKDERWTRASPILARPHTLKGSGKQWRCEACGKHAGDGAGTTGSDRMRGASCNGAGGAGKAPVAWMKWRQSYQGDNCDRAGLAELRQAVDGLRMAEAQPTDPADKKHLLLKTGVVKWCWRYGARAERNSAPRVLLKTACSGAPRTKEYERALTLLG